MSGNTLPFPYYTPGDSVADVEARFPLPPEDVRRIIEVPGTSEEGYLPILRNYLGRNGLVSTYHPEICSVFAAFQKAAAKYPNKPVLFHRTLFDVPYQPISFSDFLDRLVRIGLALVETLGSSNQDPVVTIYMPNMWQYLAVDFACQAYSIPSTSLYDLLGSDLFPHIFGLTKLPIVFTHKSKIIVLLEKKISSIKYIVVCEHLDLSEDSHLFKAALDAGITLFDLDLFEALGAQNAHALKPPALDTVLTISITLGTTSLPKGVIIPHRSMLAALTSAVLGIAPKQQKHVNTYAFLPLAHCYLRLSAYLSMGLCLPLYFPTDPFDVQKAFTDFKDVKPMSLFLVPRVLSKIELGLKAAIAKSPFIEKIVRGRVEKVRRGEDPKHFVFDTFLKAKFRKAFGFDHLEILTCGSAPVAPETIYFLKAILGVDFFCGYGLTETLAIVTLGLSDIRDAGTDGFFSPAFEVRLKDVPSMGYSWAKNRSGEVLLRGPGICTGYLGAEEAFKETCEGTWFCSGDVIHVEERGVVRVVDRIKNFFKLSQGKFVASEKVQSLYLGKNAELEQAFVYGDSLRSFLVGVFGVNVVAMGGTLLGLGMPFAYRGKVLTASDYTALAEALVAKNADQGLVKAFIGFLNTPEVVKRLLEHMNRKLGDKLTLYELVKNAYFDVNAFTVADGSMGPTLKLKRPQCKQKYLAEINRMYDEGQLVGRPKL